MSKGAYQVNDDENQNKTQPAGGSFRSCILTLLICLMMFIIILLSILYVMKGSSSALKKDAYNENSELAGLQSEKDINKATDKSSTQATPTTTNRTTAATIPTITTEIHKNHNNFDEKETTTAENKKTSTPVLISEVKENSSLHPDADITSETVSTRKIDEVSEKPDHNELFVPVSEVNENSSFHPETTSTRKFEETSKTPDDKNSFVPISVVQEYSSLHPDDDTTTETISTRKSEVNENLLHPDNGTTTETISTKKFDETSKTPKDNSSVPVSGVQEQSSLHPDYDRTTETITTRKSEINENLLHPDNDTTTETINTRKFDESVSGVQENSSFRPDDDTTTTEIATTRNINYELQETTTDKNNIISTEDTKTSNDESSSEKIVRVVFEDGDNTISSTETNAYTIGSYEENGTTGNNLISESRINTSSNNVQNGVDVQESTTASVSTPEILDTMTATSVPSVIIGQVTQNEVSPLLNILSTNKPTTDTSTYSTNKENTSLAANDQQSNNDYIFIFNESNPPDQDELQSNLTTTTTTTTQPSVEKIDNIDMNGQQYQNHKSEICLSAECKTVASRMLSLMNHSENPCDDFYEFACGAMQVDNNNRDTWERLSEQIHLIDDTAAPHFKSFKKFYTSCVEHEQNFNYSDRVYQVSQLVKEVGWIIDSEADSQSVDLTSLFAKLILRQSLPIFDVEVDIDRQTSEFILKLVPSQMYSILAESGKWSTLSEIQIHCLLEEKDALQHPQLDLNKIYSSYLQCQKNKATYLDSVQTAVESLGFFSNITIWSERSQRITDLRLTIEWDILDILDELPHPNDMQKTLLFKNSDQSDVTISDLQSKYPLIQWKTLFEMITGKPIPDNALIQTYFPNYLDKIFGQLENKTIQINNALISMYVYTLYQNLVMSQARHQREHYCLKLSAKLFQDIANNLYVKSWKNTDFKTYQKLSVDIFDQLKNKLKTEVESETKWLNEHSRESLLLKLNNMELLVNKQEDRYNNDTYLLSKYQIDFIEGNWPSNAVKMLEKYRAMLYSIHGSDSSNDNLWSYFINSYDATPTSFYSKILTVAPLGTMKQHSTKVPNYITMTQIGLPLAREIGRHFDPEGIVNLMVLSGNSMQYYQYMKLLMTNNTLNTTMLVGNQKISFDVDSELSANVRIADNTALRLLSNTYTANDNVNLPWISTSYSKQQLFFITVAQEYCSRTSVPEFMLKLYESEILPPTLRVKNIVTHSEEFSQTFQCRSKSEEIEKVSYKLQFPYLDYLDIEQYKLLLQ